ncbi:PBM domain-containing protein [Desulfonema limicola]|uniref:PBM domain-containing protein n=1 Tax=Desulfonema limicola TaxID=45656 RepID=A0A975GJH7_9BACT|nr:substrate-binding domain-containing protein [Desulfonema limicola]QTA83038.1 PBM domain-containing protein [Desulfonema limicola]
MKKTVSVFMFIIAITMYCVFIPGTEGYAEESLKFSCSAQIVEAFGADILTAFTEQTGIDVNIYKSSSDSAVNRLMSGYSHIAGSMKKLRYNYRQGQYVQIPFCKDNLAVIVNVSVKVNNLSEAQLQDIFTKAVTNWKEVGGADKKIIVVVPAKETASHQNFKDQAMKGKEIVYDFMSEQSAEVIDAVRTIPGAVSFITQGAVEKKGAVKTVSINNLSPRTSDYPYFQTMYLIAKKSHDKNVEKLIDFFKNENGKKIMKNKGMIPVSE